MASGNQASLRAMREEFVMKKAFILSRSQMSCSNNEDWKKINAKFNSGDYIAQQSASADAYRKDEEGVRKHFEDMQNKEAIKGSDTRKVTCNMFFISFLLPMKASDTGADGAGQLWGMYYDVMLIPADQEFWLKSNRAA